MKLSKQVLAFFEALDVSDRDLQDAFELLAYHLKPSFAETESPEDYEKAEDEIKKIFSKLEKNYINLSVDSAYKKLNPVNNGRADKVQKEDSPIVLGNIGDKYVVLDGNHRIINKHNKNVKYIRAVVLKMPKSFEDIMDMDGGVGKLNKSDFTA